MFFQSANTLGTKLTGEYEICENWAKQFVNSQSAAILKRSLQCLRDNITKTHFMIERILLNEKIYSPGEQISLTAWSDTLMFVEILCFVKPPTPATLKPCQECGRFPLIGGKEFLFSVSEALFAGKGGHLQIKIITTTGDSREFRIEIK